MEKGKALIQVMVKNRENKKQKGLSLIALMITIILLLILAGVTLNLTLRGKWGI